MCNIVLYASNSNGKKCSLVSTLYWNGDGLNFAADDDLSGSLYSSLCVQQQKSHRSRPRRLVFLPPASHIFLSDHQLYFIRICSVYFLPQARYITCILLEAINFPCFLECEQKNWATSINCLLQSKETNLPRVRLQIVLGKYFLKQKNGRLLDILTMNRFRAIRLSFALFFFLAMCYHRTLTASLTSKSWMGG